MSCLDNSFINCFCRLGLQERKLVKELVEQEGKHNAMLLRVLSRIWLVRFLMLFLMKCFFFFFLISIFNEMLRHLNIV